MNKALREPNSNVLIMHAVTFLISGGRGGNTTFELLYLILCALLWRTRGANK